MKLTLNCFRIVTVAVFHTDRVAFLFVNEKLGFLPAAYIPSRLYSLFLSLIRSMGTCIAFTFNYPLVVFIHHMLILFHNRKFLSFYRLALTGQIS